jgi:hypothetical protein
MVADLSSVMGSLQNNTSGDLLIKLEDYTTNIQYSAEGMTYVGMREGNYGKYYNFECIDEAGVPQAMISLHEDKVFENPGFHDILEENGISI